MPMVKCKLNFGKWVGGEIENGSQKDNNYVVFPRVSMIIPAPTLVFYIFSTQMTATFGAVNYTTLNSVVKIKMIWLYQRVPDIRHGIYRFDFLPHNAANQSSQKS